MATITNLNIPILKQELNVSLRTENYAYVQSAIESRLNVPHSADIRTSLIQASKVVAANTAENYAEKTMWTDAAKETFVKLVSAATAYVVCDKLGFDAIDLEMEYNSLNAYEAMNDAVSKAANSISATVLRSVQRNISNSNMLIERNNENERNSLNESNSGSAVNDNANGERSVRDMELSRGQQGVEGDGGDRKKSITVSGTSREQKDKISGMERAAHIGDSNRQIRNNEKHISEEVSAGNIQQHGSERNADSTSGSNSGEHGTRDEGLHSQSGTNRQSVRRSSTEPGLRGKSQDIRNASAASGGSNDKNVDPVGRDDVIGNVEYRYIRNKKYVKGETGTMLKVAERLETENISFSGKLNGDSITLTVSGSDLRDKVKNYLEEIKPQEKENSPLGNSDDLSDSENNILLMAKKIQKNIEMDESYKNQYANFLSGDLPSYKVITVSENLNVLSLIQSKSNNLVINQSDLKNSIANKEAISKKHTSGHDIAKDELFSLSEAVRNPIIILRGNEKNNPDSIVMITELKNKYGKNVFAPISLNRQNGTINRIATLYGKDDLFNYLYNHENDIISMNTKKADNLYKDIGLQLPKLNTIICYDESIAYTTDNVKYPYNNNIDKSSESMHINEKSVYKKQSPLEQIKEDFDNFKNSFTSVSDVVEQSIGIYFRQKAKDYVQHNLSDSDKNILSNVNYSLLETMYQAWLSTNEDNLFNNIYDSMDINPENWLEESRNEKMPIIHSSTDALINAVEKDHADFISQFDTVQKAMDKIFEIACKQEILILFKGLNDEELAYYKTIKHPLDVVYGEYLLSYSHTTEDVEIDIKNIVAEFVKEEKAKTSEPAVVTEAAILNDKFTFNKDRNAVDWQYYNEDGNDGKGQIVNATIYENDIVAAHKAMRDGGDWGDFIASLYNCKQVIVDNDGSDLYKQVEADFIQSNENAVFLSFGNDNDVISLIERLEAFSDEVVQLKIEEAEKDKAEGDYNEQLSKKSNTIVIDENSENITVDGHIGTWYVIDNEIINDKQLFLLESEDYGEDAAALIVDENAKVVLDEVYNGFLDYHEAFDNEIIENSPVGNLDEKDLSADIIYNFAAYHMPEIIRHMNATDEMDDMTDIFTDSEDTRIEIAKKHIMSENIPTEVFNLYPDKNLTINVQKNDEGVKVFNGNNEIHFSWKQVAEFCVAAAKNWTISEEDRTYNYLESKYTYEKIQAAVEAKTEIYLISKEDNEVRYLYDKDKDSYVRDNGDDGEKITISRGQEIDSISMWLQSDGYRVLGYSSSEITKYPDVSLSRDEFIGFVSNDLSGRKYIQNAQADEAKFRYLIYSGTTDMLYNLITEDEHIGNYTPKEMEKLFDLINNDYFERESLYNVIFQNVNKAISQQQEFPTGELAKTANEVTAANNSFYRIYQLNEATENRNIIFESIQNLSNRGIKVPDITRYDLMYEGDWDSLVGTSTEDKLETIYRIFNDEIPDDFRGHSLSVSDIVTVGNDRTESAYYVDSFGFSDVTDNFFEKSLSELQNTKEQNSPLGNLPMPDETITIEQMEQYGYKYNEVSPMLPLSKNMASELYNENQYIYKLFPNGSFQVAEGLDDLLAHNGMFGIHSNVWELYYMQHTDGFTALVKEMQKFDISNKDLFDSKLIETLNKSSDKEFSSFMLKAKEKYVDIWNDMYGAVISGCRNTSSLPPFDRLRANHDFTIEQLTYVSSIENFMNINDYMKISAEMLVSGVWQNDGGFEQINQKYFSGKLNGILNEINQYMPNEVVKENSPVGNLSVAENESQGEQLAFEYVPDNSKYKSYTSPNFNTILGLTVEIDGREFVVDTVDENNMCNLRDLTFQKTTGFPVFRHENVEFVRRHITERQSENEFPTGELSQKSENKELKHNYSITAEHFNEDGGAKTKFKNNIEAISLLKNLEADNRLAAPEEQEVLSKYVGWGGISQAFDSSNNQWANEYKQLKEILTESEYSEARASTVNSHYTSPVVINAIYNGLDSLGFKGGRILEPAMGTGNFFGAMPEDLRSNCKLHGVELDSITGRIAKQLYQNADISITGFENKNYSDNSFDVAVGNVPFGSYKLNDSRYNKENFYIHDYFFAKSLDKVKPGGVVAFVTSKGTLDKQNSSVRKYLSERAELLGAIRLPNNAFKSNAGTEVTADIIFLKKRERPIDITHNNSPEWLHLGYTDDMLPINQYFINHPEMVLGKIVEGNKLYGNQKNETMCVPIEGAELKQQLSVAIKNIQGEINTEKALYTVEKNDNEIEASPDSSFFSYTVVDDKLYYRADGDTMKLIDNEKIANRGKAMVHMRNTVHELLDLEISNTDNHNAEQIETVRKSLNAQYDNFVVEFGRINTKQNKAAFASDNTYHLLVSLENYDNDGKYVGKADIFAKNTIKPKILSEHVTLAADALVLSVAEKAKVDFDYMQQLTGKDKETLIAELGDKIFRSPDNDNNGEPIYVTADEYLTGNIRKKLERLDLVPTAFVDYDFSKNREALEMALPPLVDAADIDAKLGAAWIPPEYVQQFALEVFKVPYQTAKTLEVKYSEYTDKWNVSGYKNNYYNSEVTQIYGIPEMNAYDILEATLNMKPVNVYRDKKDEFNRPVYGQDGKPIREVDHEKSTIAQQKQQDMKRAFSEWAFKDPERREKLVKIFNEKFNSVRLREYDGDKLNFVGINPTIELRSHQKNAIARGLYSGNTLLAHEVGAGKTFEMIAIAMEGKRLGLHNKSMFAVPNSLTEQFAADFRLLYPNANILVATKKDFEKENRRTLMAKIATGDFDAVILGHSQFDRIHLSNELEEKYIKNELKLLRDALEEMKAEASGNKKSFSVKQIEQSIKNKEASLKKLQDKVSDDNVISFERLGIDKLFIDESHMYKNLDIHSKMRNVAGLGTKGSGRAFALLTKCKYLNEVTNNKGVVFASGTPVSNSMTELYTIMRYLQADKLAEAGIKTFDNWASIFAECVQSMELKPECDGKFQMKTRIQNYSCVEQLMTMYRECADIKTADMMNLERPDSEVENVVVPASRAIKREMKKISDRAKIIRVGGVLPTEDNMLKLTIDGKKVGLDLRLMDPNAPDEPNSKVNTCVKKVTEIYNDTSDKRGVQMVFCDLSTPYKDSNPNSYRVYKKDEYGDYSLAFSDKLIGKMNHESILKKFSSGKTLPKNYDKEEYGLIQPEDVILIHRTDELGNVTNEACCVENNGILRQDVSDEWFDKQGLKRYVAADSKPRFCVYDEIKAKLIANGIPEKEIAFIHDYDKAEDKQRLFSQMNEGKVRVMLGSTGKCGAGMNAQKKMVALHHLDAPARPSDMEQRNGRIVRQGNENKSVKIFRYVTDRTFDAYSYQILENKQKFISQVMTGKVKVKTCEDIDEKALDFGEVKALCAGNPLIKVKIDLETEINTLKIIKAGFDRQKYAMEDKVLHSLPIKIGAAEQIIEKIKSDIETVKKILPSVNEDNREYYPVEVNSKVYSDKEAAGAAIKAAMLSPDVLEGKEVSIGKYRGLELSIMFDKNFSKQFKACLRGEYPHYCVLNSDPGVNASGNITRLNNLINGIPDELEQSISKLEDLRADLKATEERSQEVFPRQQELEEKERELIDVDAQLKVSEIGESNEDLTEIYESLEKMFPEVLSGKETYIKLSAGECFDSLFVKQLSENQITVAHTYIQNGDLMYDPMITYEINREKRTATAVEYENSGLGIYEVYTDSSEKQADCNDFTLDWFENIENQGYERISEKENEAPKRDLQVAER